MSNAEQIARKALRGAMNTRQRISAPDCQPICVYDAAEQLGIEVIFRPEHSLGGLYNKTAQTVMIPTHRPPGRQSFTCAHEIGHWFFGHGSGIDEINDLERYQENQPLERLVDIFASYLLMPPWAVREAYARRRWSPANCTPLQAYTIAGQLGVGYETLVQHLRYSLHSISPSHTEFLLRTTPKDLRCALLGSNRSRHLVIVDDAWTKVALDLQVGDLAIIPANVAVEGRSAAIVGKHDLGLLIEGREPGVSRAESFNQSWAVYVRVSRKDFIGRSIYRHLEDPDVDENTDGNK